MPSLERISRCFLVTSFNLHSSPTFVILSFLMILINLGIHISSVSYKVSVGSYKDSEIDFTAKKADEIVYYQVT